ncbi:MaoC family dehydratase [Clostridium malenominatum]|uniref:MaoC family dehydratase n=1 Tax=Clostridium malenominatum TaxID=1539 RepID=A0ABP3U9R6_9CLOT
MYLEEFKVGEIFKLGPISLTEEEIVEFARKYDPQPIHVDYEFANNSAFKGVIASGFHTINVIWNEWVKSNRFGTEIIAGMGMDYLNWTAAVYPGDKLIALVEVVEIKPSSKGDRGVIALKFTINNEKEQTVLTTQLKAMIKSNANNKGL